MKSQNDIPLTKEEQLAREMMLPRANKNCLKVDINPNDDAEDIEMKKEKARKVMKKNQKQDWNSDMDIEEPLQFNNRGRANILKVEANHRRNEDRRSMAPKSYSENHDENQMKPRNFGLKNDKNYKGIENKRVNHLETNENNINVPNRNNFPKIKSSNSIGQNDIMKDLIEDHFNLIKKEGSLIKEDGELYEKMMKYHSISDLDYVDSVRRNLNKKIDLLLSLRNKTDLFMKKMEERSEE